MSKLYVKYGTMGAGKTLDLLRVSYQYKEKNKTVMLAKTAMSDRGEGRTTIESRLDGVGETALDISEYDNINILLDQRIKRTGKPDVIIIDECQFLSSNQINQLHEIAHLRNVPVLAYTLKINFKGKFFEGSKRLFEIGDDFEEIIGLCWCGKRARFNARVVEDKVLKEGEEVLVGDEMYVPLCPKHFLKGKVKES